MEKGNYAEVQCLKDNGYGKDKNRNKLFQR